MPIIVANAHMDSRICANTFIHIVYPTQNVENVFAHWIQAWIHAVTTFNRFVLHRIALCRISSFNGFSTLAGWLDGWMTVQKAACSKCACATQLLIESKRTVRKLWNWLHFISLYIYCWTLVGVNTRSEQNVPLYQYSAVEHAQNVANF